MNGELNASATKPPGKYSGSGGVEVLLHLFLILALGVDER